MSEDLLSSQIEGLEGLLKTLRDQKDLFVKAQGLEEAQATAREEISNEEVELQAAKEELAELLAKRAEAVRVTAKSLEAKMNAFLPEGEAVFEVIDSTPFIAWRKPDGKVVPRAGLSGGQKVFFDQALTSALIGDATLKILVYEAAEADQIRLSALIEKLSAAPDDTQILLNTWFRPEVIPDSWNVIEVE